MICVVFLTAMSGISLASAGANTEDKQSGIFEKKELNHEYAEPNYIDHAFMVLNDQQYSNQPLLPIGSEARVPEEPTIAELQQQIYDKGFNFTVSENWITNLTHEERDRLMGHVPIKPPAKPLPDNLSFRSDVEIPTLEAKLPASYDAMALGYVTPVKNQGSCGSCWIFASTTDFESDVAIAESKFFDFSEQEVGDCNIWDWFCDGGNAYVATNYFTKKGAADEACHPYVAASEGCQNCPILKNADNWRIITGSDGVLNSSQKH